MIVGTGAAAKWLGLDGEKPGKAGSAALGFLLARPATAPSRCSAGKISVGGGGDTAMEETNYLTHFASKVYLIHRRHEFRASQIMQQRVLNNPKVEVLYNKVVTDIHDPAEKRVTGLTLEDTQTGARSQLAVAGMFVAIGHRPNSDLFVGQLNLDENGYIKTHHNVRTNVYGVFACGDVQDHEYRQAVTAAGTGCMAAIEAERLLGREGDKSILGTPTDW